MADQSGRHASGDDAVAVILDGAGGGSGFPAQGHPLGAAAHEGAVPGRSPSCKEEGRGRREPGGLLLLGCGLGGGEFGPLEGAGAPGWSFLHAQRAALGLQRRRRLRLGQVGGGQQRPEDVHHPSTSPPTGVPWPPEPALTFPCFGTRLHVVNVGAVHERAGLHEPNFRRLSVDLEGKGRSEVRHLQDQEWGAFLLSCRSTLFPATTMGRVAASRPRDWATSVNNSLASSSRQRLEPRLK